MQELAGELLASGPRRDLRHAVLPGRDHRPVLARQLLHARESMAQSGGKYASNDSTYWRLVRATVIPKTMPLSTTFVVCAEVSTSRMTRDTRMPAMAPAVVSRKARST